jgi:hypothetical protein
MTHCYFVGVMNRDIDSGAASMIRAVERDFYFLNPNLLLHPGFSVKWQVASGKWHLVSRAYRLSVSEWCQMSDLSSCIDVVGHGCVVFDYKPSISILTRPRQGSRSNSEINIPTCLLCQPAHRLHTRTQVA